MEATPAAALNGAWFTDPARPARDNAGPHVLVVDDFYDDPEAIRSLALSFEYETYAPAPASRVGAAVAEQSAGRPGRWRATAFVVYHGERIGNPFYGERHNPPALMHRLEALVGEPVDETTWATGGDYWNGAFHLVEEGWVSAVHHHYKPGDIERRGWTGVVYLSPGAPASAGTSIWRSKTTGLCVAGLGARFHTDLTDFELALLVENRFNRLVLFRENVLHRTEAGFGAGANARLTQTLFFQVRE